MWPIKEDPWTRAPVEQGFVPGALLGCEDSFEETRGRARLREGDGAAGWTRGPRPA